MIADSCICGGVQRAVSEVCSVLSPQHSGRLLDLGGGHGLYAIAFKEHLPGWDVSVFDLPNITPITSGFVSEHGSDVAVLSGDFYQDPIGEGYDIIFSSFNQSGSDISLIDVVSEALKDGGHFVVRQFSPTAKNDPLANLEWNLVAFEGEDRPRRRFSGPNDRELPEFMESLQSKGFHTVKHWVFDHFSEVFIVRKGGHQDVQ